MAERRPVSPAWLRRAGAVAGLALLLSLQPAAAARKARPQLSEREQALLPMLRSASLDELAELCPQLVAEGDARLLQKLRARLLTIRPAPQPLPVVLANADALLRCQAPEAALTVLERYGPAPGAERRQWLLLRWQAANAGLNHRVAVESLRELAAGRLASLETLQLPVRRNSDGSVSTRAALDLLAGSLVSLGQPQAAAEVLLASRAPGDATARRIAEAVALLRPLPLAEQMRLLEIALEQAAAAGAWGLVSDLLDRQLALPDTPETATARARAAERRLRLSRRIDDAYGEWRVQPTAGLERHLRSPRAPGGHAGSPSPAPDR